MGNQSGVVYSTIDDLETYQNLVVGNSTSGLRRELDHINRRLVMLNRRLTELTNNEAIVKARIYNNADMSYVNSNLAADSPANPMQSLKKTPFSPTPDQTLAYDKYHLTSTTIGIKELDAELNKITHEVQAVQQMINRYQVLQTNIQVLLDSAEKKQPSNFLSQTFKRILPPQQKDLENDRIAKARSANLFLLYRLCISYRDYSTNPSTGNPGYPDETKLTKDMIVMQQTFAATAMRFPNGEFTSGETALDLNNPGSFNNSKILLQKLEAVRASAANDKMYDEVGTYVKDLRALAQDPQVSEGIQKIANIPLPTDNSMKSQTSSYPASVLRLGNFYVGSFEIPSIIDAVTKVWKRQNGNLFQDLPTCPNVVLPSPTSSNDKLLAARQQASAIQIQATTEYQNRIATAEKAIKNQNLAAVNDLPADAPYWVKHYVELYGKEDKGDLVIAENAFAFNTTFKTDVLTGIRVNVVRAWSSDQFSAIGKATKLLSSLPGYNNTLPSDTNTYQYLKNNVWYVYMSANQA